MAKVLAISLFPRFQKVSPGQLRLPWTRPHVETLIPINPFSKMAGPGKAFLA